MFIKCKKPNEKTDLVTLRINLIKMKTVEEHINIGYLILSSQYPYNINRE